MRKYDRLRMIVRDLIPDVKFIRIFLTKMLENNLSKLYISDVDIIKGELSFENKREILTKYKGRTNRYAKKIEPQIEEALESGINYQNLSADRIENIKNDMRFCYIAYGILPAEYKAFRFEEKNVTERNAYMSYQQLRIFRCRTNDILAANLFLDKSKTYEEYKNYYHRDFISIKGISNFKAFHNFISAKDEFVLKNALDSGGRGVQLIKKKEIKSERDFFNSCIRKGLYVLEEKIIQSDSMAIFNESSVNTVRVITFNTKDGIVVPYCILRIGKKGAFVDNGGNGGIIACIDYENGKVNTDGYDENGNIYTTHPNTEVVIKGYQIPNWSALRELCKEVALKTTKIKMVGWDFAHTNNGWILVEGNECPQIIGQQMILGGMKNIFEKILKEMDV